MEPDFSRQTGERERPPGSRQHPFRFHSTDNCVFRSLSLSALALPGRRRRSPRVDLTSTHTHTHTSLPWPLQSRFLLLFFSSPSLSPRCFVSPLRPPRPSPQSWIAPVDSSTAAGDYLCLVLDFLLPVEKIFPIRGNWWKNSGLIR